MQSLYFCIISLFVSIIVGITPTFADIPNPGNREVKAGIFNLDGFHSKDRNGNLEGYGIDLLGLLSEYSHLNFAFTGYDKTWQEMLDMLENGEIDLVTIARKTPYRDDSFIFSRPVGKTETILTTQIYNYTLKPHDYKTYNNMRVGALAGSSHIEYLKDFAADKGFSYTVEEYDLPEQLAAALRRGEIDAIISSNLRKTTGEKVLDIIKSDSFHVMARKEDRDIINEIDYAIEQMNQNEGNWQDDLYFRYYGPRYSMQPDFTSRELKYISSVNRGDKSITVTSRRDIPPYSYIEDGQFKGILPDYFARIMEVAGLPYTFVAPEDGEDYKRKSENNAVDIVLDRVKSHPLGEDDIYRGFTTDPYMVTGLARVTKTNFNGAIRKVALPIRSPLAPESPLLKNVDVVRYSSPNEAMTAVQNGEADVAYILPYTAQLFVNSHPDSHLYYAMVNDSGANFRMYVPASTDHELITILNKSLRGLPEGTLNQISSRYTSFNAGQMSLRHFLHINPDIFLSGVVIVALISSLIFAMWLRGRWNRRLLTATESANMELEGQLAIVEALSRDYANVLAIDEKDDSASPIKVTGFMPREFSDNPHVKSHYPDLIKAYIRQRAHPEDWEYLSQALALDTIHQHLQQKDEYSGIYRVMENNEIHHYQFYYVKVHRGTGQTGETILAGFKNIDEMIRREQEQKNALAEALAQARYASAAKTAFLNNMSHDIRTPMNAIIGFASLAVSNVRNAPMVQRYLGKIMTSGNHLLSLINDVLDMSRIESGKVKIEEKETSLPGILHDLRTIAQADIKAKQLDFQIDTLNVTNETIFCDRLRINQVLLNLLSNAMKYTQTGGKISVRVIQLSPPIDDSAAYQFCVKDNGIGMSAEFLKHVFEPFEREQTSTISGIQGTGLGLAITKNIVDMMHGSIEVESEPGKGSQFTVSFKFRVSEQTEPNAKLPQFIDKRVLVVDDDVNTCTSLSKTLSTMGMHPDWTTLGKEALIRTQFANEQGKSYGAYFIDWMMADMNGIELTRRLRKSIPADVPIIILTAYDWTDIEEEGIEAGVTAFCSKPIFLSELCDILSRPAQHNKMEIKPLTPQELFAGRRILLVEDNEMNQEIAQMILEKAGFEVEIAENGQLALDKMRDKPEGSYDLILMDVQMPVMNGYDATRAIRKLTDTAKASIPIIAMTANAFEEDREEAINAGMNGYVAKPIDIKKLFETLSEIIKGQDLKHN